MNLNWSLPNEEGRRILVESSGLKSQYGQHRRVSVSFVSCSVLVLSGTFSDATTWNCSRLPVTKSTAGDGGGGGGGAFLTTFNFKLD